MQKSFLIIFASLCFNATAQDKYTAKNYVSVSPVTVTQTTLSGFSAQYERFIGNSGKWSLVLPVSYSYGNSNPCDPTVRTRMLRAYPGIRFYPAGNSHRVSYAMGATAVAGAGSSNCNCGIDEIQTNTVVAENQVVKPDKPFSARYEAGLMFNNSLTIMATKHVFIGSDLGIGGSLVNYRNMTDPEIAFRFTFNIGYRF